MKKLLLCSVAFILTVVMPIAKPHTPKASAEIDEDIINGASIYSDEWRAYKTLPARGSIHTPPSTTQD